jgi:hypothetical protein
LEDVTEGSGSATPPPFIAADGLSKAALSGTKTGALDERPGIPTQQL